MPMMGSPVLSEAIRSLRGDLGSLGARPGLRKTNAGAQYSQKQENEADEYGVEFCVKNNIDPYAMANALTKPVSYTHLNFVECCPRSIERNLSA